MPDWLKLLNPLYHLARWRHRQRIQARLIFEYHDGQRERYGDPFALWRFLVSHPTANLEALAMAADQAEEPATTELVGVLCEAFNVSRLDSTTGEGLTDWEILDLLHQLDAFVAAAKKKRNPGPTSSESMDSASSEPAAPQNSTTSCSSDSGPAPSASS